ncbi:hypothetical protein, partial [Acidaminococcus fermentans]|uniref:hypothetical protein n=1 Tax=Acidaminococcus fermentans TaxID=905 RepID=UPI00242C481F
KGYSLDPVLRLPTSDSRLQTPDKGLLRMCNSPFFISPRKPIETIEYLLWEQKYWKLTEESDRIKASRETNACMGRCKEKERGSDHGAYG